LIEISVVVSTYTKDRLNYVLECLSSLKKQSLAPCEILLVLDPDQDLVRFYKSQVADDVKIIISKERGLSNARNEGVKNASGEIIAFIDDDAVADENWIRSLALNYDEPLVVGVGGFVKPKWEGKRSLWVPEELDWIVGCSYKGLPETKAFVRNPIGCNMSFRRDVFKNVGYFSTSIGRFGKRLLAGEEPEFSLRVFKMIPEAKIVYDPSAIVYHNVPKGRANLRYAFERSFYEGLSKAIIKSSISDSSKALSVEDAYLKHMFNATVPSRLKHFYRLENLCHLFALFASITAVFMGFSVIRLQRALS
jgi:glycosyltransferase involved in cell wall biosynthesis